MHHPTDGRVESAAPASALLLGYEVVPSRAVTPAEVQVDVPVVEVAGESPRVVDTHCIRWEQEGATHQDHRLPVPGTVTALAECLIGQAAIGQGVEDDLRLGRVEPVVEEVAPVEVGAHVRRLDPVGDVALGAGCVHVGMCLQETVQGVQFGDQFGQLGRGQVELPGDRVARPEEIL